MQRNGGPSIVALKTATLLAGPRVELVLRGCPVGEHATKGVAESAMREVKRQTRTLKFALEAHVGKIVGSPSTLRWIPTISDAISFFRIGRDDLMAEMLRSGCAWKKLVSEFGKIRPLPPSGSKGSCKWNATKTVYRTVSWAPHTNWQHSHHDGRWSRERCRVWQDERGEQRECRQLE